MASEAKFADEESSASEPFFSRVSVGFSFSTFSFMPKSLPIRHCALCGVQLAVQPERFWVDNDGEEIELCSCECAWDYAAKLDPLSYGPRAGCAPATGLMAEPAKILGLG